MSGLLPCNRAQFLRRFCCPQLEHLLLSSFPSVFFSFVFSFIHFSFVCSLTGIFLCLPFSYTPSTSLFLYLCCLWPIVCRYASPFCSTHTCAAASPAHMAVQLLQSFSSLSPAAAKPRPLFMRLIREQRVKLSQHANSKQHSPFNRFERSTKAEHKTNIYNENNVLSCTTRSPSCCFYC